MALYGRETVDAVGETVYENISADVMPTEIESLCVNCEENGTTRLLLTKIPFHREVIVVSFECEHCGYRNNEVQSGGVIQEYGVKYVLKATGGKQDLNRQIVKSEFALVALPDVDFEIPSCSQSGEITTVEGIVTRARDSLTSSQTHRRVTDPAQADAVDAFLQRFGALLDGKPFTLIIDDPSGNSFVESLTPSCADPQLTKITYTRTFEQDKLLCILADDAVDVEDDSADAVQVPEDGPAGDVLKNEVLHLTEPCPSCRTPVATNVKLVDIPHFKQAVIMATNCDHCGHRSNEVKSGAGIAEKGIRIEVSLETPDDMARDVLKSESCSLKIPELELEGGMAVMSGKFTTVEGLLDDIREQLGEQGGFIFGDSGVEDKRQAMRSLLTRLDDLIAGKLPGTHLVLDDPGGNSYVQDLYAPEIDPRLDVTRYERSFEQNEELGLNDMKVEGYENDNSGAAGYDVNSHLDNLAIR